MPRFRFQLEGVLRYREHVERQKMLGVARLEIERRAGEHAIAEYQSRIRSGKDDLRRALAPSVAAGARPAPDASRPPDAEKPGVGIDPVSARLQAAASLHLQLKAQRAAVGLAGVLKRLGDARAELARAVVARRAMERLRERRYEAWKEEESRRESAALDEIGTLGAVHRLRRGIESEARRNGP